MQNVYGLLLSYVFVAAVLFLASFLQKKLSLSARVTRKIIHISVSHWWFILLAFFDSFFCAVIGPISFILINSASYWYHLMPSMELAENRKNLGTVYFPISLLALVILGYQGSVPLFAGGVGILIMGYGDGFASLFGQKFGKFNFPVWGGIKSILGTMLMFFMSFLVVVIMTVWFGPSMTTEKLVLQAAGIGLAAAIIELITPFGLDNITVPIGTALLYTFFII
ncbi:MAG: hypothetical protein K9L24_05010 [Spirochaetia bacterium]|nr:hypothetical protein [Spirochaetia bacterium]MCF7946927.1 hypothetical protein [Spirochaetia bacterium]MCF7953401.1 hypothetical protein [Spirochaetales bacterium]